MPDFTKRVRKRLPLPDGEQVVQAAVAQPEGSISRGIAEQGTAARGVVAATRDKRAHDGDDGTSAGRIPPANGYLVITDRRVLWADQRGTGSVGEVVAAYDHAEVVSLTEAGGHRMGNVLLALRFADGSSVGLAVHKGQKPDRLLAAMRDRP